MKPQTVRLITMGLAVVLFVVALMLLNSCTLVYIEGDSNAVSDSGNHDGEIDLPARTTGDTKPAQHVLPRPDQH